MPAPPLQSATAKIERAKYHLSQLQFELSRHHHSEGASFHDDLRARQHVFSYHTPRKRLLRYAIISGEIVSQTRSALEHAVWGMVPEPNLRTGFPVILERTDYALHGLPKIAGINERAATLIEQLQPFNHGGEASLLWILHDMWKTDKHKVLNLVAVDFMGVVRNYFVGNRFFQQLTSSPANLQDGTEVRIDFPSFYKPREIRVNVEVGVRIEFDSIPEKAFETVLRELIDFGEDTIKNLVGTLV